MDLIIDKRKTDIIYVDKANNHVANSNDVIKLISINNDSNIDAYIKIFAGVYCLNDTEVAVLRHIITNTNDELSGVVCVAVAKLINKSAATIARAIDSLRAKRLIYGNGANALKVSTSIATNAKAISNAKFIVIELRPEVTSNGVSL